MKRILPLKDLYKNILALIRYFEEGVLKLFEQGKTLDVLILDKRQML